KAPCFYSVASARDIGCSCFEPQSTRLRTDSPCRTVAAVIRPGCPVKPCSLNSWFSVAAFHSAHGVPRSASWASCDWSGECPTTDEIAPALSLESVTEVTKVGLLSLLSRLSRYATCNLSLQLIGSSIQGGGIHFT